MNRENTEYLIENFPNLYQDAVCSPKESLMCFGFECGDGWFELIKELSEKLEPEAGVVAIQVKEKFGGLRFYLRGGAPDRVWDLIDEAEEKSEVTCEVCGKPGTLRGGGWVRTLCDECDKEK